MLPIYIGVGDEANQGLCTGTENYWCVNKDASEDDINATLDFMYWCVSSDEGTKAMANDMGFVIPFKNAVESPTSSSRPNKEMNRRRQDPCGLELLHHAFRELEERRWFCSDCLRRRYRQLG